MNLNAVCRGCGFRTDHRSKLRAIAIEILQTVALAGVFYLVISLLTARVVVEGPSMRPTLLSGEWIVVNRLTYKVGAPRRGDVVVFLPPTNAQTDDLIKRVIGLPGETVEIRDGSVWVNGAPLEEIYVSGTTYPDNKWQLGEDDLFVMGDNRPISLDSRSFGPIKLHGGGGQGLVDLLAAPGMGAARMEERRQGSGCHSGGKRFPVQYSPTRCTHAGGCSSPADRATTGLFHDTTNDIPRPLRRHARNARWARLNPAWSPITQNWRARWCRCRTSRPGSATSAAIANTTKTRWKRCG